MAALTNARGLQDEAAGALLQYNERLKKPQRTRRPRLIGSKESANREGSGQGIDLPSGVAAGVHAADHRSHAGAYDKVWPDAQTIQHPKHSNVCQPFGTASG
jgi:hypothetical protein